ncbi:MAG: isopentenyl phosphate kinase [Sulfolobales archaeon]
MILKIGGSIVTDKNRPLTIDINAIEAVCSDIEKAYREGVKRLVIIHGGGSYGHYIVRKILESKGHIDEDGFSEITWWMGELNRELVSRLRRRGLPAISIATHAVFYEDSPGLFNYLFEPIHIMVERGLIPVLYGDAIVSREKGYVVLSGDTISWLLALRLNSRKVLFATNVDGVFDRDPSQPGARLLKEFRVSRDMASLEGSSSSYDVTGGMRRKILEGIEALRSGVRALVFNGRKNGYIYKALIGYEDIGTVILY